MSEEKLITIIFKARPILAEMMGKIKEARGLQSNTDVMRLAIYELYNAHFKAYGKDTLSTSGSTSIKMPKLTKEQKEDKEQHDICMLLDGTVATNEAGYKSCTYMIHEKVNPKLVNHFTQTIPFGMLNKTNIARQYSPNREEVEQTLEQNEQ